MQKNTKFKLIVGFLAILALVVSIYARFTAQFPSDLYLTLRLQSFDNHFLLSVMQWVSFIFGGWCSALVGCYHRYPCLVAYRQAGGYPNSGRGIAHACKHSLKVSHQPSTAFAGSSSRLIPWARQWIPQWACLLRYSRIWTPGLFYLHQCEESQPADDVSGRFDNLNSFDRHFQGLSGSPLAQRRHRRLPYRRSLIKYAGLVAPGLDWQTPGREIGLQ